MSSALRAIAASCGYREVKGPSEVGYRDGRSDGAAGRPDSLVSVLTGLSPGKEAERVDDKVGTFESVFRASVEDPGAF